MNTATNVTNVLPLPSRAFKMPLNKLDSFEGRKAIALLLRNWERSSKQNTFTLLAKNVGLCTRTVSNIASETTFSPRLHTILMIMYGLGFTAVRFD